MNKEIKVYLAFFISEEYNFIRKNGCDKFDEFNKNPKGGRILK